MEESIDCLALLIKEQVNFTLDSVVIGVRCAGSQLR